MRKYQPIWDILKRDRIVSLAADPLLHKRIINAVAKEKHKDTGWKFLTLEQGKRFKIHHKIEGKLITFTLEKDTSFYLRDL